ncbi:Lrp/AsnC family transcriptional regulator [Bosea psychrotolerans]|uniref:AsnC family transcriptional regulator n=1 Tax=Bosea psychrotolerans TaxID=1871628 RepID=A0A2S4LYU3_9HYPH|nr:Lrp/AsnC family transcriptional regulator [Bosea psychrotolerans]POR47578.1 AsnC family transcriptional regulator [Bosea psychrotolerans]
MASQGQSLDPFDLAILRELQRDSTRSIEDLAALVNLSRNACWRRIKLLEEAGVIRARVALVEASKVNAGLTVLIRIRTSQHSAKWAEAFRDTVRALPEIVGAYRTSGEVDYILRARVPDVAAYDRLYQRLIARIDMVDVAASFVMEEIKDTTEVPLGYA